MNLYTVPFYRASPFIRIIIPFVAGIMFQWTANLPLGICGAIALLACIGVTAPSFLPEKQQYGLLMLRGACLNLLIACSGSALLSIHDSRNDSNSFGRTYSPGNKYLLIINEPLSEKPGSFKTTASVKYVLSGDKIRSCRGDILLYFDKAPSNKSLRYGDILYTSELPSQVSATGNPAAFDFREYCFFQGINHQLFLRAGKFKVLPERKINWLKSFIFNLREKIVAVISANIHGAREAGLAQALLIGYKDNLDRDLIQSYSNTGVVHVIAISGLHLGLIYAILVMLTSRLTRSHFGKWMQLSLIVAGVWLFTLLAGASASVVRSAVMFTCIAIGNALSRKSSVYNSLAASAFLLLAYNPFWLWDTGFQLSYAAVLSIVIYQKPVTNLVYPSNKLLLILWKSCSVTLSAQILTTPVTIFYFHQFPIFFLFTNLVAIPLSSIILLGEILLCCIAWLPPAAHMLGNLLSSLIRLMNFAVELADSLPDANWQPLQIDQYQYLLLYVFAGLISAWLMFRLRACLIPALTSLLLIFVIRSFSFRSASRQHKLIVYNVPKSMAVDYMAGRNCLFVADSLFIRDAIQQRFHVRPARIRYRIGNVLPQFANHDHLRFLVGDLRIIIAQTLSELPPADLIIVGGNPKGKIRDLFADHTVPQGQSRLPIIIFSSSNSSYRIKQWQSECRALGLRTHAVTTHGAFVMNFN
ncbi:MAG: ComEC/Rec2 family competence protein [Flavitalea sp.]